MKYDACIIGGGIVGLSTAYALSQQKPDLRIVLLEKEFVIVKHQTGHNSGVIHSGINYKPGSLKATLCKEGRDELITYCRHNNIHFEITGKVIVATNPSQLDGLEKLYQLGVANGLEGIARLTPAQVKEKEYFVNSVAGIYVPQTGIVDFAVVGRSLADNITKKNVDILVNHRVINIEKCDNKVYVETPHGEFETKMLITCGGLQSDLIAKLTTPDLDLRIIPFRGEYYKLALGKSDLVKGLIYPVPDPAFPFLGVHFTRMIDGTVKAGPNAVFAFKREGYEKFDFNLRETVQSLTWPGFRRMALPNLKMGLGEMHRSLSKSAFTNELQKLIPAINEEDLTTYSSGVRAQVCRRDGSLPNDFIFVEQPQIIHVCNAPSPAATAGLAIGKYIAKKALAHLR